MEAHSDLGLIILLAADCVYLHRNSRVFYIIFLLTLGTQQVFGAIAGELNKFLSYLFLCMCFSGLVLELFDCFFCFCRCDFGA